ncbi:MAG: hypothetical protein AB1Z63_04805 [Candidatus Limnocylindrales bacterium]
MKKRAFGMVAVAAFAIAAVGAPVAADVGGGNSGDAAGNPACTTRVGPEVRFVADLGRVPMAGPNSTNAWLGESDSPGQALKFVCAPGSE